MKLLRRFPLRHSSPSTNIITVSKAAKSTTPVTLDEDLEALKRNKQITRSEEAKRLAFKNFARVEQTDNGVDSEREAMLESGLLSEDLVLERAGKENKLPEWRKRNTGRFVGQEG